MAVSSLLRRRRFDARVVSSCSSIRSLSATGAGDGSSSSFPDDLAKILQQVRDGTLSVNDAEKKLIRTTTTQKDSRSPEEVLASFANLDHSRASRAGFPEAVFGEGKTADQIARILDDMARHANEQSGHEKDHTADTIKQTPILATRVPRELWQEISMIPLQHGQINYHETARIVSMIPSSLKNTMKTNYNNDDSTTNYVFSKRIVVATAGTTDLPVAEEAAVTLEAAHCQVDRIYDVGVAGLHRILRNLPRLQDPNVGCVIVCAGMDGALPSVVGGLVSCPVLAVPTSIGYGVSLGGISAMLTMLNSCAPGVAVQNIDNGFGAAAFAYKCIK
jgi:pyridinium-3,5-biscarboxylic acid mononucleotide synthase